MKRIVKLAASALFAASLVACSSSEAPQDPAKATQDPVGAINASAQALKAGDILQTVRLVLPEDKFAEAKKKYEEGVKANPPSDEDKAQFAEAMAKFTADGAEDALMAELEPQLAMFDSQYAAQMPMMIGMGRGFAAQAIQQDATLTPEQKTEATAAIDAMGNWLGGVKLSDRALVRQAVGEAVATARALKMSSLDELQNMSFEDMLGKVGVAFTGLKKIFKVYGFDLDATLDSMKSEIVSQEGDTAKVKVSYTLFGQNLSSQTDMVKVGDRWYGKDSMAKIGEAFNPAPAAEEVVIDEEEVIDETVDGEEEAVTEEAASE
ncbi:MAG: hypothetical protein R3F04_01055 [Lysobacteraceae bacterium]